MYLTLLITKIRLPLPAQTLTGCSNSDSLIPAQPLASPYRNNHVVKALRRRISYLVMGTLHPLLLRPYNRQDNDNNVSFDGYEQKIEFFAHKIAKVFFFWKDNADRVYIHSSHSFAEVIIGEPEGKVPCFTDFYPFHSVRILSRYFFYHTQRISRFPFDIDQGGKYWLYLSRNSI